MFKKRFLLIVIIVAFVLTGIWFLTEGDITAPNIILEEEMEFMGRNQQLKFSVEDNKSGTKFIRVSISQGNQEKEISMLNLPMEGIRKKEVTIDVNQKSLGLKDGPATLIISAGDYSLFDNKTLWEKEIIIDTRPPRIEIISLNHYITTGGSCLALYHVSQDAVKSGILVGDAFFEGYPSGAEGLHVVYFALPRDSSTSTPIVLTAQDRAANAARISVPHFIRVKKFKEVNLNISDGFLDRKMPEFSSRHDDLGDNNLDIFLEVNRRLRRENSQQIAAICKKSHPEKLWKGAFLRMKGARKAQFADKRTYYYNGKAIDEQVHMGVDLAATRRFPVKAANGGIAVFADYLGIFGNTVIVDHGQGLFSAYAHLSSFQVKPGTEVNRGDVVGNTGATGLAGGDHLHFSMIVHGVFVNPIEWWDPHWIKDNITIKLAPDKST